VETLGVVPVAERYERIASRRFLVTHLRTEICREFTVDEYGLVHDDEGSFRRV